MDEKAPANPPTPVPNAARTRRGWHWGATAAAVLLVAGAGAFLLGWPGPLHRPTDVPLEGELIVTVTKKGAEAQKSPRIEEAGAAPVHAGDKMQLIARFNQPAYTYLVWLDGSGSAVPLYPWNQDSIDIKNVNQQPPACQAVKIVFNPMTISNGWKFGKRGGLETVLLLARRTPLGEDAGLGPLLDAVPPVKMRDRGEVAVLGLARGAASAESLLSLKRGTSDEIREVDGPVQTLMERLKDQFELIRAVRFAHEGE